MTKVNRNRAIFCPEILDFIAFFQKIRKAEKPSCKMTDNMV